jgi:hypothetical protein
LAALLERRRPRGRSTGHLYSVGARDDIGAALLCALLTLVVDEKALAVRSHGDWTFKRVTEIQTWRLHLIASGDAMH